MTTKLNLHVTNEKSAFMFLNYYESLIDSDTSQIFSLRACDIDEYRNMLDDNDIEHDEKSFFYDEKSECILIKKSICKQIVEKMYDEDDNECINFRHIVKKLYDDYIDMRNNLSVIDNFRKNYIYISMRDDISYLLFEDFAKILTKSSISDFKYDSTDFVCSREAAEKLIEFYSEVEEINYYEVNSLQYVVDFIKASIKDETDVIMHCKSSYMFLDLYVANKELNRYKNKDAHMIER